MTPWFAIKKIYCFNISGRLLNWRARRSRKYRQFNGLERERIEKNIFVSLKRTNETTTKIEEEETWRNAVQHAKAMGILSSELLFNVCVCLGPGSGCSTTTTIWLNSVWTNWELCTKRYLAKRKLIKLILFISYSVFYILFCSQLFITIDVDHNKLNARQPNRWLVSDR